MTDLPALLSRLLAAGFEDVEVAIRATTSVPAPTWRVIGYWRNERIAYTQLFGEEDDLPRIEAAMLEKLEALKVERAAEAARQSAAAAAKLIAMEDARRQIDAAKAAKALLPGFYMDGSVHVIGDRDCEECGGGPIDCEHCGGLVHEQSVYGPSIMRICDRCGKPDADEPTDPEQRRA
jgi:hypothetical protein